MKDKHLIDVLGEIEPALIEESAPGKLPAAGADAKTGGRRICWRKWIPAVAAMLVAALLIGVLMGDGIPGFFPTDTTGTDDGRGVPMPSVFAPVRLASPVYPTMAQYPAVDSDFSSISQATSAWYTSLMIQQSYFGAGESLKPFFASTVENFLSDADGENRVYSPLNVYMALAMLAETTQGESRQQILNLLGSSSIENLRTQVHAVWNANYCDDGRTANILANSIWLNENIPYSETTVQNLAEYYYASSFRGKMGSDEYNQLLHDWMNEHTADLLKDQIDGIEMDSMTLLALVSTVYYEAGWTTGFKTEKNTRAPFYGANGQTECTMMHQFLSGYTYSWGERFTSVGLAMSGGRMDFILPDEGVRVEDLLTDAQVLSYIASGNTGENSKLMDINLSIPKFDVQSQMDLVGKLKSMGVSDCFDGATADFSGEAFAGQLQVDKILHGARVTVNEDGAKAVAYVYEDVIITSPPPIELQKIDFTVDRPFLFVLRNSEGLPLFVGVVNQVNG